MTEPASAGGTPPAEITHRRVLNVALPIVLSNATFPILGAVDTGVIGQMGAAAPIGAVGIGAVILTSIYWIFGFLRMGTTGLVAQAKGRGDIPETGAVLTRALMIAGAAGLFFILFQLPVFWAAFRIAPASAEVESLARDYMAIRIWGAPASIAVYAVTGWLIAVERTRSVLVLQLWLNGLNIGLDFLFVLGFGWGVGGVALATLISEWTAIGLGLWLCRAAFTGSQWRDWARVFDPERVRRMMAVNRDIMIRSILLLIPMVSFMFTGAAFGDVTLAANQILLQFLNITAFALDGFAFAAETLVGQALGARARSRLRRAALLTSQWGAVSAVLLATVFALAGPAIIDVMTTAVDVRDAARTYLPWMVAAPLLGLTSWMLDGIFIGATRTRDMRNAMIWSFLVFVAAALLLAPLFGNHGLWAAMMIFFVARAVTLGLRYPALEAEADSPA
ncbi:MATE family efflux transporter [Oceanomicrobium pacificus]|uniref:MATE family efflux transporter n=1 Tax=Oceanomicrobium pacificus TaxID=2692916 RepID=A0A6B0U345_9RHOB|nr:MATE family efflux transporter [Oceanomicrobium pacificus]MXU65391.1 MATE family efflux transporter [Oceanomicrobium pacificus]